MLSRVGETLYWVARYVERAENVARLINVNNMLMLDLPKGCLLYTSPIPRERTRSRMPAYS